MLVDGIWHQIYSKIHIIMIVYVFSFLFISGILSDLLKSGEVVDLKIEEVDFEEVIHRFLAKESGV